MKAETLNYTGEAAVTDRGSLKLFESKKLLSIAEEVKKFVTYSKFPFILVSSHTRLEKLHLKIDLNDSFLTLIVSIKLCLNKISK